MAMQAAKANSLSNDEQPLYVLTEAVRDALRDGANFSKFQVRTVELMVAESQKRLVGKGALNNLKTRFWSEKNRYLYLIESHTVERKYALELELDSTVIFYVPQVPCWNVERVLEGGRRHRANPTVDFLVIKSDCAELVECKSSGWLIAHEKEGEWECRGNGWTNVPMEAWAKENGFIYKVYVVDLPVAHCLRANEAMYATLQLPLTAEETRVAERAIKALEIRPCSIEDLSDTLPGFDERIALNLLARRQCFGPINSTSLNVPQHFYLYTDAQQATVVDAQRLVALHSETGQPKDLDAITLASAKDLERGKKRYALSMAILDGTVKGSARARQLAAKVKDALAEGKPGLAVCLTNFAASGNRQSRLDPLQRQSMEWVIRAFWNSGRSRTRLALWFELEKECNRQHVPTPSLETLSLNLRREDAAKRALATEGMRGYQAARPISDPLARSGTALGYGHTLHIDSSQFDNRCYLDLEDAPSKNKPWFYLGIDETTTKPMAHSIYFGRACTNGVALLLRDFVRRHGFLPFVIVLDRGSENDSEWLQRFCLEQGVTLIHTPTGGSRYNSQAEVAIKRVNAEVAHDLPGSTKPDQCGRKVDGKFKSEKTARLAFMTINRLVESFLYIDLLKTPDEADRTPQEKMDDAISRYGVMGKPQTLDDAFLIRTSVDVKFTGKASEKRGICFASGIFTSHELSLALRTAQPEEVRKDCENPALIVVKIQNRWIRATKNTILTIASLNPLEKLFELLWGPYARSGKRRRVRAVASERYQRHDEGASPDATLPGTSVTPTSPERPDTSTDDSLDKCVTNELWESCEALEEV